MTVGAFLDPMDPESERLRSRLCELGLPAVADRIAAMEADDLTLGALALELVARKSRVRPEDAAALDAVAVELCLLARSPAWVRCPPWIIEKARADVADLHRARAL